MDGRTEPWSSKLPVRNWPIERTTSRTTAAARKDPFQKKYIILTYCRRSTYCFRLYVSSDMNLSIFIIFFFLVGEGQEEERDPMVLSFSTGVIFLTPRPWLDPDTYFLEEEEINPEKGRNNNNNNNNNKQSNHRSKRSIHFIQPLQSGATQHKERIFRWFGIHNPSCNPSTVVGILFSF